MKCFDEQEGTRLDVKICKYQVLVFMVFTIWVQPDFKMITDVTNLDAQEGLQAETIMRNETTVWTEGEHMRGDSLEASHTKVHSEKSGRMGNDV